MSGGSVNPYEELAADELEAEEDAARARRRQQLDRLDRADKLLWVLAHEHPPRFTRGELASRFDIGRSTLYERLARIKKELTPRYCECGCGGELPRKSTRRRKYLAHHGGHAHVRHQRAMRRRETAR
jgi:hypothetical protein